MDLVITVDMSGSIIKDEQRDPTNWNIMMDFLIDLVQSQRFTIDDDNVQIGVVSFGSS